MKVSQKTVDRVEKILRSDVRWAISRGIRWNPKRTAEPDHNKYQAKKCGVCAIGACLIRRGGRPRSWGVADAARVLRADEDFVSNVYFGVMETDRWLKACGPLAAEGHKLALRLKRFARAYQKAYNAKKAKKA